MGLGELYASFFVFFFSGERGALNVERLSLSTPLPRGGEEPGRGYVEEQSLFWGSRQLSNSVYTRSSAFFARTHGLRIPYIKFALCRILPCREMGKYRGALNVQKTVKMCSKFLSKIGTVQWENSWPLIIITSRASVIYTDLHFFFYYRIILLSPCPPSDIYEKNDIVTL